MLILHFDHMERSGYFFANEQISVKEAMFKGKILGPPFPSAYNLRKAGITVYARFSEFEPINRLFDKFLVDPLASWNLDRYVQLFKEADQNHELIIVGPSLHGHMTDEQVLKVALDYPIVKGIITRMPGLERIINVADDSSQ